MLEVDIDNCIPTLVWNELVSIIGADDEDGLAEFHMIELAVKNYRVWRAFLQEYLDVSASEAKKVLIGLFFTAFPKNDLPFLWSLRKLLASASQIILGSRSYEYLANKFSDRKNPRATRFSYALFGKEDHILSELQETLQRIIPRAAVLSYMFDGAIFKLPADEVDLVQDAVKVVSEKHQVTMKVTVF